METRVLQNGELNKVLSEDRPIHDWYRFVLSFPPHIVQNYLKRFSISSEHTVLDPFCGTGTTLVECKKLGIPSVGIEAHPMSHFASSVKTNWMVQPNKLYTASKEVYQRASEKLNEQGIRDLPDFFKCNARISNLLSLNADGKRLLLKDSISPLPLHKALTLLEMIVEQPASYSKYQKIAFAKTIVATASNLHFGPEVGVRKIKTDAPMLSPWLENLKSIVDDLSLYQEQKRVPCQVILGDARTPANHIPPHSIDFVFTSPPYPNEKDYTRTTRLESVLLGFIRNMDELRKHKQLLLRSNTRNVYKADNDDIHMLGHKKILGIADQIEKRRLYLGKTSGFEKLYHRVTKLYFGGMKRHFEQLRGILRPGAILAYVVGDQASYLRIMIRTGTLLAEIAESLGYEVVGIDLFRTRIATATGDRLNEEVVVLRWKG
jgi:hypothetical protein